MKAFFYDWGGANEWLFYAINGLHNDALDGFMSLGTYLGDHDRFAPYVVALILIAWWNVARGRDTHRWFTALTVFGVAYLVDGFLVSWLKHALDFPRPPAALPPDTIHIVGKPELQNSLPSGHAVFAMTLAASLWPLLNRPWRIAAVTFFIWVALSRISLGMHFPADVVAGALLAWIVALVIRLAINAAVSPRKPGVRAPRRLLRRRHKR